MKLKVRAESKDFIIFGIFVIFLLYLIALGVSNITSIANYGKIHGLSPFIAFSSEYIFTTLLLFLFALGGLLVSVKSHFFEFEKGIGITTSKKDKGYSRWAKPAEIIKQKDIEVVSIYDEKSPYAGIPLYYKDKNVYVDNGEYHTLVIGSTGSGKSTLIILPTISILSKKRESMIITDPKGEIYEKSANMLKAKGYNILLLNFRSPQEGNSWNPMALPYKLYKDGNQDKAIELLDDLGLNILYDPTNNAEPFWEKTAADYFTGLSLGLFEDADENQININSLSTMSTVGEENFGGSNYMKEYFNLKDPSSAAFTNATGTVMAPNDTKGSILSVFKQKIKLFATRENLSEMLSHSDIDLESIGEKPTAVFLIIHDEKKTYHSLATIFLKQVYEVLINTAQKHGGKLPVKTNFVIDEFANMPPFTDITTMITASRSRDIRFTLIIQNFAQLESIYNKDAETIRGNCNNLIYLISTELKALEEISKMCGEVKSKKDDKTNSTPLVTISDLQRMKDKEAIIMRLRTNPFKTKLKASYEISFDKEYPKAAFPKREKVGYGIFDIKTFVKEKKKENLKKMMEKNNDEANINSEVKSRDEFNILPFKNPFTNNLEEKSNTNNITEEFNVDNLISKIDAKIAELEAEEKALQNKPEQKENKESNPKKNHIELEDENEDDFFDDFFDK